MSERAQQPTGPSLAPRRGDGRTLARLVLTGFMGAGKSTVGTELARILRWQFLDLDRCIEAKCGQTVAEIFRRHGEAHFRVQERQTIEELSSHKRVVLALGGGSVEDEGTLTSLLGAPKTCLIFLDAPLTELLGRLSMADRSRPNLTTPAELEERHTRRLPHYRSAHLTVVTTGLSPREVATRVLEQLKNDGCLLEG